jgi:hypothetical protein
MEILRALASSTMVPNLGSPLPFSISLIWEVVIPEIAHKFSCDIPLDLRWSRNTYCLICLNISVGHLNPENEILKFELYAGISAIFKILA